jgi:hypothetical protein
MTRRRILPSHDVNKNDRESNVEKKILFATEMTL